MRRRLGFWGTLAAVSGAAAAVAYAGFGGCESAEPTRVARIDRLVVDKSARRLEAYDRHRLVRTYLVATGSDGGPKRWEGDGLTPEGRYTIDRRHPSQRFHRFLHVSYPNAADRRRYAELRARGDVPDGAGIGGAIGIHGPPLELPDFLASMFRARSTAGCIAVTKSEVEELYSAVVPNASITIRP
jgi:murein L,D-transpeptidase YafK